MITLKHAFCWLNANQRRIGKLNKFFPVFHQFAVSHSLSLMILIQENKLKSESHGQKIQMKSILSLYKDYRSTSEVEQKTPRRRIRCCELSNFEPRAQPSTSKRTTGYFIELYDSIIFLSQNAHAFMIVILYPYFSIHISFIKNSVTCKKN